MATLMGMESILQLQEADGLEFDTDKGENSSVKWIQTMETTYGTKSRASIQHTMVTHPHYVQ